MTTTQVWTDGAYSGAIGGWACLVEGELDSGVYGKTVNEAELYAILRAVELSPSGLGVHIHTDSKLAIGLLTNWHTDKPRLLDLVEAIEAVVYSKKQTLTLSHTKAHRADDANLKVDRAARYEARAARLSTHCTSPSSPSGVHTFQ